jgi:predicted lipoprotein with Yx(FWY)xxD motif
MTRSRPINFLASAAVLPLVGLAVAACGGSGSGGATAATPASTSTSSSTSAPKTAGPKPAVVRVANSRLGKILVNSTGRTLYLFKADVGTKSACTGACATAWPPLRTGGKPTAAGGAKAALLGTTKRSDGAAEVTYNGHPLYLFVKDTKPGETTGQGVVAFGAAWFVVSPAGNEIAHKPSAHAGASSSSPPAAPAAPPAAKAQPAPQPAPPPAPKPAPKPAPPAAKPAPPAPQPAPPANSGIPQNNGGDGDADNNGGPSDGDGNI